MNAFYITRSLAQTSLAVYNCLKYLIKINFLPTCPIKTFTKQPQGLILTQFLTQGLTSQLESLEKLPTSLYHTCAEPGISLRSCRRGNEP